MKDDDDNWDFLIRDEKRPHLIAAIKCAHKNGLSLVPPMCDGSKRPFLSELKPYQERLPTEAELSDWYDEENKMTGIGYVCGAVSGNMEVMDFHEDNYRKFSGEAFMTATELCIVLEHIERGWSEYSPKGIHLYYRCSEIGGSTTLAARPKLPKEMKHAHDNTQTLITVHGEGGYVIATPSYGKVNLVGEYKIMQGGPDTIVTITPEQRDGLHVLARTFNVNPVEESIAESNPLTPESNGTDEAVDDIDTRSGSLSDDYTVAQHIDEHSVTAEHQAAKEHTGEVAEPIVPMSDMGWELPPLLFGKFNVPELSASLLPCVYGDFTDAVSKSTQTPVGLAVMIMLSTIATCVQGKFEVTPYKGYAEPLQIWTMTALQSGSRKTAVLQKITAPLAMWETEKVTEMELQIKKTRTQRDITERRIKNLTLLASRTEDISVREGIANEIELLLLDMPPKLNAPKMYSDDVTPVGLQKLLEEHNGRMSIIADEGGIFQVMAGMHSGGNVNINVFLQAHAGSTIRVDRAGRTVTINDPSLTFGMAIQNDVIEKLSKSNKGSFRGNGCLARFLFCIPESNIGYRDVKNSYEVSEALISLYNESVKSLLAIPCPTTENGGKRGLGLDAEALDGWNDFRERIETDLRPSGSLHMIQDWSGKLPGATLRIAGLMHVAEFGVTKDKISYDTMKNAIAIAEILCDHAKLAFDIMGSDQVVEDAKDVFKWIISNGEECFNRNKLHTDRHGRYTTVKRLIAALGVLTERNIISEPVAKPTGRRPEIVHFVNPRVWGLVAA